MRRTLAVSLGLRAILLALLVYGVARPDLPQFHGKGIVLRLVVYPLFTAIVPAVWLARRRRDRYPFDVDQLLVLPFIFDSGGNAANLYDRIWWWDKLEHGVNWFVLVGAVALLLARTHVGTRELVGLAVGFGAVTAILWELAEYVTFIHSNRRELRTAYTNTLGDLLWGGLVGSLVGAVSAAVFARRKPTTAADAHAAAQS
ncbi:MAG: hypothetical protein ACXVQ3_07065 [Gaiellaceae bacterium]